MNPAGVRTVQEVELMTPNERAQLVNESFITDFVQSRSGILGQGKRKGPCVDGSAGTFRQQPSVSSIRRTISVSENFFEQLDLLLGEGRGSDG